MTLTIKRLNELSKADLLALGVFMRDEIRPESISAGSAWVCQAKQRPHYYSDKSLSRLQGLSEIDTWVALDGVPIGYCQVARGIPDRLIMTFLVDEHLLPLEQVRVADDLALQSTKDMLADDCPGKSDLIIPILLDAKGESYADLCGFTKVKEPSIATPRRISFKALRENILKRQREEPK